MARTVRIRISRKLDDLARLVKKLFERHTKLGDKSPLKGFDIEGIPAQIEKAEKHLKKARALHAEAEGETELANKIFGLAEGQTIKNPKGTLYHKAGKSRNQLKITHEGEEEQISKYGYNVVIS